MVTKRFACGHVRIAVAPPIPNTGEGGAAEGWMAASRPGTTAGPQHSGRCSRSSPSTDAGHGQLTAWSSPSPPWKPARDLTPAGWLPPTPDRGVAALPERLARLIPSLLLPLPSFTSACCPHRACAVSPSATVCTQEIPTPVFFSCQEASLELSVPFLSYLVLGTIL